MRLLTGVAICWTAAFLMGAATHKAPAIAGKTEECTTYGLLTGKKWACTPEEKAALMRQEKAR